SRKVYVIGVGMTKFEKPGSKAWDYPDMAKEAGMKALEDAGIPYSEVEQAVVGYVYGESTCGQRAVYQLGLTGIPVYNVNNTYSQFQDEYSIEDILAAPMVHEPLTKLQCCPTSDGSGAAVLASEDFVKKHNLQDKAIEILAQTMVTDTGDTFDSKSSIKLIGSEMTGLAANRVYEQTGLGPDDVDVIELHDCFSANEMITYEALGLAKEGTAHKLVEEEAF